MENDSLNKNQLFDENVLNIYVKECIFASAKYVSRSTRIFSDNSFKSNIFSGAKKLILTSVSTLKLFLLNFNYLGGRGAPISVVLEIPSTS